MSTYYLSRGKIPFTALKGLSIDMSSNSEQRYVKETVEKDTTDDYVCLTDGTNHIWARRIAGDNVFLATYSTNNPEQIIEALEKHFGVSLIDEHDEKYRALMEQYPDDFVNLDALVENPEGWKKWLPAEK